MLPSRPAPSTSPADNPSTPALTNPSVAAVNSARQVWIRIHLWNPSNAECPLPIDTLLDTGAGGGDYVSVSFWLTILDWSGNRLILRTRKSDRGALRAANPNGSTVPPLRIIGSSVIPVLFPLETRARKVRIRVVKGIPYSFILGASFLRRPAVSSPLTRMKFSVSPRHHLGYPSLT